MSQSLASAGAFLGSLRGVQWEEEARLSRRQRGGGWRSSPWPQSAAAHLGSLGQLLSEAAMLASGSDGGHAAATESVPQTPLGPPARPPAAPRRHSLEDEGVLPAGQLPEGYVPGVDVVVVIPAGRCRRERGVNRRRWQVDAAASTLSVLYLQERQFMRKGGVRGEEPGGAR